MRTSRGVTSRLPRRFCSQLLVALVFGAWFLAGSGDHVAAQAPAMRWDGMFEIISARPESPEPWAPPPQPANAPSRISRHAISGDGRYVVFESDATNMGFSPPAVYRRDRRTGQTELLRPFARNAVISADGNHVAFELCEPWMRPDSAAICDVWAVDVRDWRMTPLSVAAYGAFGDNDSSTPVLSANGRFAVFVTKAGNIVGGAGGTKQVVLRDRDPDGNGILDDGFALVETISVDRFSGSAPANADSDSVEVSDDGRFVAFRSRASNLVTGDTNNTWDVFVRDRWALETRRLNLRFSSGQSPDAIDPGQLSMSANGRYVAFASVDPVLAPASPSDTNNALDVFLYDLQSFSLTRVDIGGGPGNFVPGNGPTSWPTLSADGRYISLQSPSSNVANAPLPPGTQIYVVDRALPRLTRVSVAPEGATPNQRCILPSISADGSVVLFWSLATNLVTLGAPPTSEQLYAAVHLAITPAEVLVPGRGGVGTFSVTAQQHTMWWATWDWNQQWLWNVEQPAWGIGSGSMAFEAHEPNPAPTTRSMTIRVGAKSARFTQDVGLSVTAVSPALGPMSGGTTITVRGTGFEPGMLVHIGGQTTTGQFVDASTLTAVTPPNDRRGLAPVTVVTPDGRFAWLDNAFLYLDSTPPEVWGGASGNQGRNGWFNGDVYVGFGWWDPESEATATCPPLTVTTDTSGTTYSCTATSEGGTGSASVTVRRDATPPAITVTSPLTGQLFELNSAPVSAFTCADATSGVAECGIDTPSGSPIDTSISGWRQFSTSAIDLAGNVKGTSIDYAVSTGVCTSPVEGLQTWLRFEGDLFDVMSSNSTSNAGMPPDTYVTGEAGQAYQFVSRTTQSLEHYHDGRLNFTSAFSVATWLKPGSSLTGTLVWSPYQFRLERTGTGTIYWVLAHPGIANSIGTSTARTPLDTWSHVVFTYNAGEVKLYVNGRLDRTWTASDTTLRNAGYSNRIRIGGPDEFGGYPYVGALDELQFFNRALSPGEAENIFMAGASGVCLPTPTVLEVPSPITTTYKAGTYPGIAILRDAAGQPLAGKPITLYQRVPGSAADTTMVTDENGMVRWDAPFNAGAGTYSQGFTAYFAGDLQHQHSRWVNATVNVQKATPRITFEAPAPITYPTALGEVQLTATADAPGFFSYSPDWGQTPYPGTQTLTARFYASDYRNYEHVSKSVTLEVLKGQPNVTVTGGTFTYDGQPHPATASATEYRGLPLTPVTVTYNGLPDAPVAPGVYTVVATFPGDDRHVARSVSTTLTINKATPWIGFSTPSTITYDGQSHGLTATVYGVGGSLGAVPVTYNGAAEQPVNVGLYSVSASFAGDANHVSRTMTTTLRINPATPVVTVTGGSFTYDGQPHDATVTVTGIGGEVLASPVTVTYNNGASRPVTVGSYTVSASAAALGNYSAATGTGTLTIVKGTPTLSVVGGSFVFDRQAHAATVSATGVLGETLGPLTIRYSGNPFAPVNAGTYEVVVSYAGDASYEPATATATLTIAKAPIVLSWAAPASIPYSTTLSTVQLNAGARTVDGAYLGGTFIYTPAEGAVLDPGVHTLSAAFTPFDANFESGTVTTTITVRKLTLGAQVTGSGHHTYDGQPHGLTAKIVGAFGVELGPLTITYNGSSSLPVNAGFYQAMISFAGDDYHNAVNIPVFIWIDRATPTLSWNAPAAIVYGTPLGAAQLNAQASVPGTISYSPAAGTLLGAGAGRPLSATFVPADSVNYNWGNGSTAITVVPAPLTVRANDAVKPYGAPLPTLTAAFAGFVNGESPASLGGVLAFATTATPASAVGIYPLAPSGVSSPNYAITFAAGTLAVIKAPVTVSVSTSPEPSGYEMPMTFTATVAAAQSAPTAPQGTVRFFDGAALLGTASISGGTATLTTAGLDAGTRTIEARYDGDASFDTGAGSSPHVVKAASATPAIALSSSRNPSSTGQSVTLTANVSMSSGAVTGTIAFYDGATLIGSSTIASGRATLTTTALAAGSHAITARFSGSAAAPPSISPVFVQAVGASGWKNRTTTTSLTSSGNPAPIGGSITFTATVSATLSGEPAGSILFMVDGAVVGDPAGVPVTAISSSAARASLAVTGLARGRHKVTAIYLGSSTHKGSAGALTQTVN